MLFNSYAYLFLLLPISAGVFYWIGASGHHRIAISWLVVVSLFFYGWWNPAYLLLIVGSMLGNYAIGIILSEAGSRNKRLILAAGVMTNLSMLGYFKYANFFVDNANIIFGTNFNLDNIILPLAISFFTFQQVAYLVDAYKGETREYNFLHYCLFVTFFPQLIAGPIVHHKEMLPQFTSDSIYRFKTSNLAIGSSIFILGLFKKVFLADNVAIYATPVFAAADSGQSIGFYDGWSASLSYSLQLYFDFSGYADMAIGSARLFGIKLPLNFNSPYKSKSIVEFWRRWHMTLSRFLRDYLYIPLGGSRKGRIRRYINLMITMLLGGFWHGAGWTFIAWGGLHGSYLVINHLWQSICKSLSLQWLSTARGFRVFAWVLTYLAVVVAWVFFRAETFDGAIRILSAMMAFDEIYQPIANIVSAFTTNTNDGLSKNLVDGLMATAWIVVLTFITLVLPNTQEFMRRWEPAYQADQIAEQKLKSEILFEWCPSIKWALILGAMLTVSLAFMQAPSEFLYWQF
ncbi:MAG: MBOAT family protein [Methylococcales bacterium]